MKNNLRVILAKKKMTLSALHDKTGIALTTLSYLNREMTKNPDSLTLIKIASALGVTLDELVDINEYEEV